MAAVNPTKQNLVSWWAMETTGTRADSHGSNNLTDVNTVARKTGRVNYGADFEADNNEYLTINPNSSLYLEDQDFTFSFWAKNESLWFRVFFAINGGTGTKSYYLSLDAVTGKPTLHLSSDGTAILASVTGSTAMNTGTWYHIVCRRSNADGKIYITMNDGTPVSANCTSGASVYSPNKPFRIGVTSINADIDYCYDGVIDEFAYWKGKCLSDDEIEWLYNSGNGRTYSELGEGITFIPKVVIF